MSMKLEVKEKYPDEIKRLIEDYNNGVELEDVMEVNLAIDGILQLVFHTQENYRKLATDLLKRIGNLQPGFLKKGIRVLLHRYKGNDKEKSNYASVALGKLTETPVKELIDDQKTLKKILTEHQERISRKKIEEKKKKEFLEKVKRKEIKYVGITGEFLRLGQFYNKLLIDEDEIAAREVVEDLIKKTIQCYKEEDMDGFKMGCSTFSLIAKPENREPFINDVVSKLQKDVKEKKKKEKEAYEEFLINTITAIEDMFPKKFKYRSIAKERMEEKKKEQKKKIQLIKELQKKSINIDVTWEKEVKELAEKYNDALKTQDEDKMEEVIDVLKSFLYEENQYLANSAIQLYSQLLQKNFKLVKRFTERLMKKYKKPKNALILEENIEILDNKELLDNEIRSYLIQDKQKREEKRRKEREKRRKEIERQERLKVEFSADWSNVLLELIEEINNNFINEDKKDAKKLILGTFKDYIYANDDEVSRQAQLFLNNVAKKYPEIIKEIIPEIIELFQSEHERRYIAVDFLGDLITNPNREILFDDLLDEDLLNKIKKENEAREEEIKQEQLKDKWDAIKLDVTTIVVDLEYDKKLQKVCRAYNEAIKAKEKEEVVKHVQTIIDWFVNEKEEERLNQIIEVLGKIAKQNIELISPAIDMFLDMVESEDEDTKFRAIKGLGEVTVQRPGWAYMGISKLVELSTEDKDETTRMKAFLELSRVGKANPTMLMEHKEPIIEALNDPNKHVRRLAAYTLGAMAEAIPLEAKEAIPALRDALHDDYFLVRRFADKALKLIRTAMRK
ncbi:MAG: HEAT repeat domain-containing protein [Promethearchaeia archaeon]